jgi:polysaccharide export outer membrane protein
MRLICQRLAAAALVLSAVGCAPTASLPPAVDPAVIDATAPGAAIVNGAEGYRVNSGDRLRVTVFRQLDLSGEFVLDDGGFFALPLVGAINGGGRTSRELEKDIETAFEEGGFLVRPQVGVQVLTYRPFYILGEVNQPGSYPYVSGMTTITAIARAGGFTARARRSAMTISRNDDDSVRSVDATAEILPGDILTIHERFF